MSRINPVTALLRPGGIAVIGASERSNWFRSLHRNVTALGSRDVWLVNPRGEDVAGIATHRRVADIEGDVALACVLVRAELVNPVLREVGEAGIRNVVVIASGFEEAGDEGRKRAEELSAIAAEYELNLLGPNTSGFVNVREDYACFGSSLELPLIKGRVGIVSQSGALAGQLMRLAQRRGVGLSAVLGTGNEAVITASDGIAHFVHDDETAVIATFLEGIKDVDKFEVVAREAATAGKPIVALKVGRTPAGRRAALSHTGALVGDDTVVSAAFRKYGIVRVNTLDELLAVAGLLAHHRTIRGRRIGVIAPSGGFCDIVADAASDVDLELPDLSAITLETLEAVLPYYGTAKNPLDLTGNIVSDRTIGLRTVTALSRDEGLDAVVYCNPIPYQASDAVLEPILTGLQELSAGSAVPVVLQESLSVDLPVANHAMLAERGLYMSVGLELTMKALSAAAWWTERNAAFDPHRPLRAAGAVASGAADRMWSENEARLRLDRAGVPVVPGALARDRAEAVAIAEKLGYPVVVKAVSAQLAHKSDVGGVKLNLTSAEQVATAVDEVMERAGAVVELDGVLVTSMRGSGTELLVSVTVDPEWGAMLTVGLGGIWVEVLGDTSSRLLPVSEAEIAEMLGELRAGALFGPHRRDGDRVDVPALTAAVARIAELADEMRPTLHTLELNPVWISGDRVEALDVLIVTRDAPG